ncbi:MAG: hypothetical protein HC802_00125 [Caldilineaceae bacterium]|nr:hypothetical protein [Caldilineaceae bacterium]
MLNASGFELLSADIVPESLRRGNSLLVAATPVTDRQPERMGDVETANYLADIPDRLPHFAAEVAASLEQFRAYLAAGRSAGKRFAAYGAGGRGVIFLAMAEISNLDIQYVCDRNDALHGFITPVTHIPVVAPEQLTIDYVDEVIVFSTGYMREISEQLSEYQRLGGRLVSFLDLLAVS